MPTLRSASGRQRGVGLRHTPPGPARQTVTLMEFIYRVSPVCQVGVLGEESGVCCCVHFYTCDVSSRTKFSLAPVLYSAWPLFCGRKSGRQSSALPLFCGRKSVRQSSALPLFCVQPGPCSVVGNPSNKVQPCPCSVFSLAPVLCSALPLFCGRKSVRQSSVLSLF